MKIFSAKPNYKNELKECYSLAKKLRHITSKKNPRLRKKLLNKYLGDELAIELMVAEFASFFKCRAIELGLINPSYELQATKISAMLSDLQAQIRLKVQKSSSLPIVRRRTIGLISKEINVLRKSVLSKLNFKLGCIVEHRNKVDVISVYLWGKN